MFVVFIGYLLLLNSVVHMGKTLKTASSLIEKFCAAWPGEKYFGVYRFLPVFFGAGACLELFLIKFRFKEANFCKFHF